MRIPPTKSLSRFSREAPERVAAAPLPKQLRHPQQIQRVLPQNFFLFRKPVTERIIPNPVAILAKQPFADGPFQPAAERNAVGWFFRPAILDVSAVQLVRRVGKDGVKRLPM